MSSNEWLEYEEDQSLDLSFPSTFAEIFSNQINESLKKSFNEIGEIWLSIGIPVNKRDEKIEELRSVILDQIEKFVQNENKELNDCRNYSEYKLNEINNILRDLTLEPFVLPHGKTLIARNKILLNKYNELLEIKNERIGKLERLTEKLNKTCISLGTNFEKPTFSTNIPSEAELMNLRTILMKHEQTLCERKTHFESIKAIVSKLQFDLQYVPINDTENMLLNSVKDSFIFSQKNMSLLMDFHRKLIQMFNCVKKEINDLKDKLQHLYDRLDVTKNDREQFSQSLTGTFADIKQLIEQEIEKYEIIKKNSMEKIIKNIKKDIHALFEKCMITEFDESILESDDFNDELLLKLETEYEKLNRYNELYENVFQKLREWEDSLEKLLFLEKKSLDPNRFTNRGGALLQNERDRKLLNKKLPRLEKEIRSLISATESKENFAFSTYGMDIDDYFQKNWKHFSSSKDSVIKSGSKKNSGSESAKKSATLSAQKCRVPFSPRVNNMSRKDIDPQKSSAKGVMRNLDFDMKRTLDLEMELQFQKHVQQDDILHSTLLENTENKNPISLQSKFSNPNSIALKRKAMRRRSRSCDDLLKLPRLKMNKMPSSAFVRQIEIPSKKPPFLP